MNSTGQLFVISDGFAGSTKRPMEAFSRLMNVGMSYGAFHFNPVIGFLEFPEWKKIDLSSGFYLYNVSARSGDPLVCKPERVPGAQSDIKKPIIRDLMDRAENRAVSLPEGPVFGAIAMRPAPFRASRPGWVAALAAGVVCQPREMALYDGIMHDILIDHEAEEAVMVGTAEDRHRANVSASERLPRDVAKDIVSAPIWGYAKDPSPLPFTG